MSTELIAQAERYCKEHKHRLTKPRLEVLKTIAKSRKPIGAYQALNQLKSTLNNPKPPTVYRAIDFWQNCQFIHRIESLNAYVACKAGHLHKGSQFMICDDCGLVIETHLCHMPDALKDCAKNQSFSPSNWNFEIHGQCQGCATKS